jgi:flavin-binding protein dodecin
MTAGTYTLGWRHQGTWLRSRVGSRQLPERKENRVAVTKIIEVVGSSPESSDGAVRAALDEARKSLRNIKAVDVVSTGLRGEDLSEWRALVRISFLVERVGE